MNNVTLKRGEASILRGISWDISEGEHWALLGPNGSGKTMTLRIVLGYLWPSSGSISVLGHSFGTYDLRQLRRDIGWVGFDLQYQLIQRQDKVLDVVISGHYACIGLYDEIREPEFVEKAMALLTDVGCAGLAERNFATLSYGEQKRVLIARALITEPSLLVLDEPCTGLDLAARERFLVAVEELVARKQGFSLIFVTHHTEEILPFITHCHLLKQGRTFGCGTKESVLTEDVLRSLFALPLSLRERSGRYWSYL